MNTNLVADVTLYPTERGGRRGPTPRDWYGCICQIEGANWDCRILLNGIAIVPGESRRVGIAFLSGSVAEKAVRAAGDFVLWELRAIGEGKVVE
jgi:hypothetical protein